MAKRLGLFFVLGALVAGGPAAAAICTIDDVPAATLLLPYFEVHLDDPWGINTLFSVNNASATAVLGHVTVWSDQSVPVLDFDVYLTGYDVITISLRDILVFRNLPLTASDGQDPDDTISNQGAISQDINFASCNGVLPYRNPAISPSFQAHLQAWLTGVQSPVTGNCAGASNGDRIARGYVTIDTVNACNLLFPSQLAAGYDAVLTDQNVLWGDYFYVYDKHELAQGETLVHIESCPACFAPGNHTFYGRYAAATAIDAREPLPTALATRFLLGAPLFENGTDLLIWREGDESAAGYGCNLPGPPSWHPLPLTQVVVFDEEENPVETEDCPSGDPTCDQEVLIPDEAQRVDVGADLLAPFPFGWVYLNLQHPEIVAAYGDDDAQAWVTAAMDAEGRFALAFDAVQLDSACTPNALVLPLP